MADVKDLTGERVLLRAPALEDAGELFTSVASDPEVTRYMSWTAHPDVAETRRVINEVFNIGGERSWRSGYAAPKRSSAHAGFGRSRCTAWTSVTIWAVNGGVGG
jgi:RimJ/RimL family protein N-acetyltransferase